ncbi:transcriptional regulator with XRE-family HTH domain [Anoxybacillus kamchatkensis]|uniref:helix-turn-helix transcriptional regulator n=1 Tax=Anoxybacillus ayderensis TaxID=265546 RepID=UPI0015EBD050|nr:helix-turn-helix transcriptional regulator [Anoxybacillus ayderensis]MBA2879334.1 transcriptional regulator with XRE-family HTH domain [Anoxybacillus ayderensis]
MQRDFVERLKKIRNEKEISIETLANETGVSVQVLKAIEQGEKKQRFSYPIVQRIANVLKIEIEDLIKV